jgi:hypothetical protein
MRVLVFLASCSYVTASIQHDAWKSVKPPEDVLTTLLLAGPSLKPARTGAPRPTRVKSRARFPVMIPRITLPDAASKALKGIDLKDPNELSDKDYDAYSGAAILGTLIFFLLPGAAINSLDFGDILFDFVFSALTGGGIGAYAALRKDDIGEKANQFGGFLSGLGDIPRITLPSAITEALTGIGLKSPNDLSNADYNSYSGAAILGTLSIFATLGAAVADIEILALPANFIFSALTGGGIAAYAALRSDDIGTKAREIGGKVAGVFPAAVKAVPEVVEEAPKVVEAVVEAVPEAVEEAPKAVEAVPEVVEEAAKVVEAVVEAVPEAVEEAAKVVEAVVEAMPEVVEEAAKVVEAVVEAMPEVVEEAPKAVEAVPEVVESGRSGKGGQKSEYRPVGAVVPELVKKSKTKPEPVKAAFAKDRPKPKAEVSSWYDSGVRLTSEPAKAQKRTTSSVEMAAPVSLVAETDVEDETAESLTAEEEKEAWYEDVADIQERRRKLQQRRSTQQQKFWNNQSPPTRDNQAESGLIQRWFED